MRSSFGDFELRGVLDALPFGLHVWVLDHPAQLRLEYANATAAELMPNRRLEAGLPYAEIFPPDGQSARIASEIVATIGTGVARENMLVERAGQQPLRLTIRPLGELRAVVAFRLRGAVSSRATPEQYFDAVFYSAEDAILTKDAHGTVTSWNPAAELLYGYREADIVGRPVDILLPPDRPNEVREILERLAKGERVASFETVRRTADGRLVDVSLTISPILDVDRTFVGAASIARDLTVQRLLEQRLQQTERLEAIGRLAGAIAHDFNNLLTVFRASAELLSADRTEASVEETARTVLGAAALGAALTGQLLAFARNQVVRPKVFDLGELLRETMPVFERLLGEDVQLDLRLADRPLPVHADEAQIQQVILNLCVNAREAMPEGGTLTVVARPFDLDIAAAALHPGVEPGCYVGIEVTDTGVGMDAATVKRVFEPFFTTKAEGTGLGLATTYGIVRQSGGHVMVYSEPGIGTTFRVLLPPAAETATLLPEPTTTPLAAGTLSILLVEDTEAVRGLVCRLLVSAGHEVVAVATPAEALERAAHDPDGFDLLVTDVVLPGMSGTELVTRLRERRPELNVIFTSGYPAEAADDAAFAGPYSEFVQKPFGLDDLLQAIGRLRG